MIVQVAYDVEKSWEGDFQLNKVDATPTMLFYSSAY